MIMTPNEINDSLDHELTQAALKAINFVNRSKELEPGSFAESAVSSAAVFSYHPYIILLQNIQSNLIVASENLKFMADVRTQFRNSKPSVPMPIFPFLSIARICIENASTIIWLIRDQSPAWRMQSGIQFGITEMNTLNAFLYSYHSIACNEILLKSSSLPTSHVDADCDAGWTQKIEYLDALKKYCAENDLNPVPTPRFTSGDAKTMSLMTYVGGQKLEHLYKQISGSSHGNQWAFQQNTTVVSTSATIIEDGEVVPKKAYTLNPVLITTILQASLELTIEATDLYVSLFSKNGIVY
jgi:hypothetical protein